MSKKNDFEYIRKKIAGTKRQCRKNKLDKKIVKAICYHRNKKGHLKLNVDDENNLPRFKCPKCKQTVDFTVFENLDKKGVKKKIKKTMNDARNLVECAKVMINPSKDRQIAEKLSKFEIDLEKSKRMIKIMLAKNFENTNSGQKKNKKKKRVHYGNSAIF